MFENPAGMDIIWLNNTKMGAAGWLIVSRHCSRVWMNPTLRYRIQTVPELTVANSPIRRCMTGSSPGREAVSRLGVSRRTPAIPAGHSGTEKSAGIKLHMERLHLTHVWASLTCRLWYEKKRSNGWRVLKESACLLMLSRIDSRGCSERRSECDWALQIGIKAK